MPDQDQRSRRLAQFATAFGLAGGSGDGRYAAVVRRHRHQELLRDDDIGALLETGELLALVNLGHELGKRRHPGG